MNSTMRMISGAIAAIAVLAVMQGDLLKERDTYEWPTEKAVCDKLASWQDLKFGVLLHWGIYSVPGIVESWNICNEDWINRDTLLTCAAYTDWYNSLADDFCPNAFDPSQWARVCRDAGMRYVVFTSKHHDGFCMWDTPTTDFTIARHAFRSDSRRDVLRHVLDAFRAEHFMAGVYFSKPDWHSQDYWWDAYARKGRNVNYPVALHPERWERFKRFTHRQVEEIMSGYGPIDILWLDGGWVYPANRGQDLDLASLASMARLRQPGLLVVDRTIGGPYENYLTPERGIPPRRLDCPWESCIPLSDDWGYVRRPHWKSAHQVVATLVEVVAKGGNLLLGVGPTPEGLIEPEAVRRLKAIGQWLKANGRAIYGTRPTSPCRDGDVWFTQSRDGRSLFAISAPADSTTARTSISWQGHRPSASQRIYLLSTGEPLRFETKGDKVEVALPAPVSGAVALEMR